MKIGRRPVLLLKMILTLASALWTGFFHGTTQWMFSMVLGGFGTSAYEAVIQLCVFNMFYVHERGRALSVYLFGQQLGSILGLITGGSGADALGWRWAQYMSAIINAAAAATSTAAITSTTPAAHESNSNDDEAKHVDSKRPRTSDVSISRRRRTRHPRPQLPAEIAAVDVLRRIRHVILALLQAARSSAVNLGVGYTVQPFVEAGGHGWCFTVYGVLVVGSRGGGVVVGWWGRKWRRGWKGRYGGFLRERRGGRWVWCDDLAVGGVCHGY
ncbi:major facilitator superfamily domain-containing protein [Phyllosticta paracitricarpa]